MRAESLLLGVLSERLSTPVPRPELVSSDPVLVGYRKLAGRPLRSPVPLRLAGDLARFLAELHALPIEDVPLPTADWRAGLHELVEEFRRDAVPLLAAAERPRAEAMFAAYETKESNFAFRPAVVHADVGPEHLLTDGERLTGVIDWSDAMIGDPAIDLAWLLNGAGEEFAAELSARLDLGLDDPMRRRALFFHRLGPWHEVTYGLSVGGPDLVRSGLEGVRDRLPRD